LITVTFNNDDPNVVRSDMAAMLGFSAVGPAAVVVTAEPGDQAKTDTAEVPPKATRGRKPKAETPVTTQPETDKALETIQNIQNIQTGGERNPPAEEQKQPETPPLTQDDIRKAAGTYVQKFGMENAQADVGKLLMAVAGVPNMSGLEGKPQDQLALIVKTISECVESGKQYVAPAPTGALA
jgi:hypothetical protein